MCSGIAVCSSMWRPAEDTDMQFDLSCATALNKNSPAFEGLPILRCFLFCFNAVAHDKSSCCMSVSSADAAPCRRPRKSLGTWSTLTW